MQKMNEVLTDIAGTLNEVLPPAKLTPWTPVHQQSTSASFQFVSSDSDEVLQ